MAEGFVHLTKINVVELLDEIVTQAERHGWERLHTSGSSVRRAHIQRDGLCLNLAAARNVTAYGPLIPFADGTFSAMGWPGYDRLLFNASTGYDSDLPWYFQPGSYRARYSATPEDIGRKAAFCGLIGSGSALNAYLFFYENPAALLVVLETVAGSFQWLAAGIIDKAYDFPGGQFFGASVGERCESYDQVRPLHKMFVRVDHPEVVHAFQDMWRAGWVTPAAVEMYDDFPYPQQGRQPGQAVPGTWRVVDGTLTVASDVVNRAWDATSGRMWTHPLRVYAQRDENTKSYIGQIPHLQHVSTEVVTGATPLKFEGVDYLGFPVSTRFTPFSPDGASATVSGFFTYNWHGVGFMARKPEPLIEEPEDG